MKTQLTKNEEIVLNAYKNSEYTNNEGKKLLNDFELVNEGILSWDEIYWANEGLLSKELIEVYTIEEKDVDNYCLKN